MTGATEAAEAVFALALGGFLFIVIGGAFSSSMSGASFLDFQLWGVVYLLAALVLGGATVYAFVMRIVN